MRSDGRRADGARPVAMRPRPSLARTARVVAGLGAAGLLAACGVNAQSFGDGDPRKAISQLLSVTYGEANGAKGCALLDEGARDRLAASAAGTCAIALSNTSPVIPGTRDDATDTAIVVSDLRFTDRVRGDRATVHVTGRGANLTFGLVRLSRGGDGTPLSPSTPWRVSSGEQQLLENVAPGAAGTGTGTTTSNVVPTPPDD